MSWTHHKDDDCYLVTSKHCPFIEFVDMDGHRHGFHSSQLLSYRLETAVAVSSAIPPDTLTLAFSIGDVVVTGWRLALLADRLLDGDLLGVRPVQSSRDSFAGRYANADPSKCLVASITVCPIAKDSSPS